MKRVEHAKRNQHGGVVRQFLWGWSLFYRIFYFIVYLFCRYAIVPYFTFLKWMMVVTDEETSMIRRCEEENEYYERKRGKPKGPIFSLFSYSDKFVGVPAIFIIYIVLLFFACYFSMQNSDFIAVRCPRCSKIHYHLER